MFPSQDRSLAPRIIQVLRAAVKPTEFERGLFVMYPILAEKINSSKYLHVNAPKGLKAWDGFRMATSGEFIPIDTAIRIRDLYLPDISLETLFMRDDHSSALTVAEAGNIMLHTMPGEVMPEIANAVYLHICNKAENMPSSRGIDYAFGWCLAIGRVAGVREERARRAGK